ncbi:MAG: hypothetical protein R3B89_06415 [Polyangiaceae bacterium]
MLDPTVTRERIEKALEAAEKRAAAFTKPVTQEMPLKRYWFASDATARNPRQLARLARPSFWG